MANMRCHVAYDSLAGSVSRPVPPPHQLPWARRAVSQPAGVSYCRQGVQGRARFCPPVWHAVSSGSPPGDEHPTGKPSSREERAGPSGRGFGSGAGGDEKGASRRTAAKRPAAPVSKKDRARTPVVAGATDPDQIQKLMRQLDEVEGGGKGATPARGRGRVDFAQVESWGTGDGGQPELEQLRLRSFTSDAAPPPRLRSGPQQQRQQETEPGGKEAASFYEQLVLRIQQLDAQGEISVAQERPLPPFERWKFGEERYLRFLVDQLAVHEALEHAVHRAEEEGAREAPSARALATFGPGLGLARSQALRGDIDSLASELRAANGGAAIDLPSPTAQAAAYAKYIAQLEGNAWDARLQDGDEEGACLRLLAHVFSVHVAHLTTGMRVGAKAVGCLSGLIRAKAVAFYRDYPPHAADPLRVFVEAVNKAGNVLGSDQVLQEKVMAELPKSLGKAASLMSQLAVVEEGSDKVEYLV